VGFLPLANGSPTGPRPIGDPGSLDKPHLVLPPTTCPTPFVPAPIAPDVGPAPADTGRTPRSNRNAHAAPRPGSALAPLGSLAYD
jgi:hypothetical protein